MITIKNIAKLANVSLSTVSKALNNRPDISIKTRNKILEIAVKYNYNPNAFGRGLKSGMTGNIGVIFSREQNPFSNNPFYSRVLEGIEAELAINNYNLVLSIMTVNSKKQLPKMVCEKNIDGLILVGIFAESFLENIILESQKVILVDPKTNFNKCSQVFIDNEHGALLATNYLIKAGHTKIGFVSGELNRVSFQKRYEGYIKALKYNNIKINKNLIKVGGLEMGDELVKQLLTDEKPTAIFATNDINALKGYKAIYDFNYKIPDDISIIGFDDISLAKFATPPLTTIRVYKEELGSIAVRMLLRLIKDVNAGVVTTIVPTKLVERKSVEKLIN